jgi:methionine-S-sulfoxide reductase
MIRLGLLFILLAWVIRGPLAMAGETPMEKAEKATLAGGCFWCMQPVYDKLPGVVSTTVGYTGGAKANPTYEEVSTGRTGHFEAIEVLYDPSRISYPELLEAFWRSIDPTNDAGQFADLGPQYRTAIFYHDEEQKQQALASKEKLEKSGKFDEPVISAVLPASRFYPAEEYHQKYYVKNAGHYTLYKKGSGREGFLTKVWGGG